MSIFDRYLLKFFLPLNDPRAGLSAARRFSELIQDQWLESHEIEQLQEQRFSRLIETVRSDIPFFGKYELLSSSPKSLREKLADYPIITKQMMRSKAIQMRPLKGLPARATCATTGGTTGQPIKIWQGRERRASTLAAYWRGKSWLGLWPWTRGVRAGAFGGGSWYGRLRMRLTNQWSLDLFGRSRVELLEIAKWLQQLSPEYIEGYVNNLLALGQVCHDAGVQIGRILTTGEMLYDHQRKELGRLFKGKVSDYYGSNEVGSIAFECEFGTRHISDENVIVEVVDETNHNVWDRPGRILLTDLHNFLTPIIRYEVGDIGIMTKDTCPCGRGLTVLKSLEGRTQDSIRNSKGEQLTAVFFAGRFRESELLGQVQLVQTGLSTVEVLFTGEPEGAQIDLDAIKQEIQDRLGRNMLIRYQHVPALNLTRRGKKQLIIGLKAE